MMHSYLHKSFQIYLFNTIPPIPACKNNFLSIFTISYVKSLPQTEQAIGNQRFQLTCSKATVKFPVSFSGRLTS